jgi:hypothetical protein
MSLAIDMSRSNLCFKLCLLERGVQITIDIRFRIYIKKWTLNFVKPTFG